MKREFLKAMGLTDEQIDEVMGEHGKTTNSLKTDIETLRQEATSLKEQLDNANSKIEEFKSMDIDKIKSEAEDYRVKFEQSERDAKEKLEKMQFDHILENALILAKAKDPKLVKVLLEGDALKLKGDEIIGLKEQLDKIKLEKDYLFNSDDTEKEPVIVKSTKSTKGTTSSVSKEDFMSMSYAERFKLKNDNPSLYETLRGE